MQRCFFTQGKGKRKKTTKTNKQKNTACICGTEKSLKKMHPKEWQQNGGKKPVLVLYLLTFMIM